MDNVAPSGTNVDAPELTARVFLSTMHVAFAAEKDKAPVESDNVAVAITSMPLAEWIKAADHPFIDWCIDRLEFCDQLEAKLWVLLSDEPGELFQGKRPATKKQFEKLQEEFEMAFPRQSRLLRRLANRMAQFAGIRW